jgi:hypothetical protein
VPLFKGEGDAPSAELPTVDIRAASPGLAAGMKSAPRVGHQPKPFARMYDRSMTGVPGAALGLSRVAPGTPVMNRSSMERARSALPSEAARTKGAALPASPRRRGLRLGRASVVHAWPSSFIQREGKKQRRSRARVPPFSKERGKAHKPLSLSLSLTLSF